MQNYLYLNIGLNEDNVSDISNPEYNIGMNGEDWECLLSSSLERTYKWVDETGKILGEKSTLNPLLASGDSKIRCVATVKIRYKTCDLTGSTLHLIESNYFLYFNWMGTIQIFIRIILLLFFIDDFIFFYTSSCKPVPWKMKFIKVSSVHSEIPPVATAWTKNMTDFEEQ